jgi:hypothetical protein
MFDSVFEMLAVRFASHAHIVRTNDEEASWLRLGNQLGNSGVVVEIAAYTHRGMRPYFA